MDVGTSISDHQHSTHRHPIVECHLCFGTLLNPIWIAWCAQYRVPIFCDTCKHRHTTLWPQQTMESLMARGIVAWRAQPRTGHLRSETPPLQRMLKRIYYFQMLLFTGYNFPPKAEVKWNRQYEEFLFQRKNSFHYQLFEENTLPREMLSTETCLFWDTQPMTTYLIKIHLKERDFHWELGKDIFVSSFIHSLSMFSQTPSSVSPSTLHSHM